MAFLLITGLTALVVVLAGLVHGARLRGFRAARRTAARAELLIDQLQRQASNHLDVDPFAQVVLQEINKYKQKGIQ